MKQFFVTEEILKFFEGKNVTNANVIKAVPNYMDYATELTVYNKQYTMELTKSSEEFFHHIISDVNMTKREFLNKIEDTLEYLEDSSKEYYFGGSDIEYGYYEISEYIESKRIETNKEVVERLLKLIKQEIMKRKDGMKLTKEFLLKIANNPEIMKKLKEMEIQ